MIDLLLKNWWARDEWILFTSFNLIDIKSSDPDLRDFRFRISIRSLK